VQLLQHCPRLCNLKYACRAGDEGLSTQSMQRLAAALLAVQELDLSLHPQLDASCLAALAQCKTLRKVSAGCDLAAWLTAPAQNSGASALECSVMFVCADTGMRTSQNRASTSLSNSKASPARLGEAGQLRYPPPLLLVACR
jgi:hypothetical protein